MKHHLSKIGTVLVLLLALGAPPVAAQQVEAPTESEIETYAAAVLSVEQVAEDYRTEAEQAESESEMATLREQYSRALSDAVRDEGMSVQRYNEIFQAAQANRELQERINSAIRDLDS